MKDEKAPPVKTCAECKHFVYQANAAHKNRCGKFKDKGEPMPIAAIRIESGHCSHGKAFEK